MKNQLPNPIKLQPSPVLSPAPSPNQSPAEATLRLIASLPAPQGLEGRIQAALKTAPRPARILQWPTALAPGSHWMRAAAAAAIVFVVAGGGWGIYTRVQPAQPNQPARLGVLPPHTGAAAGFSSAGAMRTPQTLTGPVVAPTAAQPAPGKPVTQHKKLQANPARQAAATTPAEPVAK